MTDTARQSLNEFGNNARTWAIPDGAFVYRTDGRTFVGYLEDVSVERKFSPRLTARFVPDDTDTYLYQFRDGPQDAHPDFDQEWTV